jgi:cation diffusion facilitator family transporter
MDTSPDSPPLLSPDEHGLVAIAKIRRVTWISIGVDLGLALLKFTLGSLAGSSAIIADGVHSLSDLGTSAGVLLGVNYWSAPADEEHPYGHSRIETLVTAGIGLMLVLAACLIAYDALAKMRRPATLVPPGKIAIVAAAVSIVVKEWLYRWTAKVGQRAKSPACIANAWHHRADALGSVPALIAVAVASINPRWAFVDHVGALVVSLFILRTAWTIIVPALADLTDRGASAQDVALLRAIVYGVEGVRTAHRLRTRRSGTSIFVDVHIEVDGGLTVRDGHHISEEVRHALLRSGPNVVDVVVHLEPDDYGMQ